MSDKLVASDYELKGYEKAKADLDKLYSRRLAILMTLPDDESRAVELRKLRDVYEANLRSIKDSFVGGSSKRKNDLVDDKWEEVEDESQSNKRVVVKDKMGDQMDVAESKMNFGFEGMDTMAESDNWVKPPSTVDTGAFQSMQNDKFLPRSRGIKWFPKGDERNKKIMAYLKEHNPSRYWSLVGPYLERKNYPYKDFGTLHVKRGTQFTRNMFGKRWSEATPEQQQARKRFGYSGRGRYVGNTGFSGRGALWGRNMGSALGGALGSRFGAFGTSIGSQLGGFAGDKLSDMAESGVKSLANYVSGRGGYDLGGGNSGLNVNSLINNGMSTRHIGSLGDETNAITISHTEYIGDITPSTDGFQTQYFLALNPGLPQTFPWLSNIAQFYEEYEFVQLIFNVKSLVTEGNSDSKGSVILATQYNPLSPAFRNKQQMENYDFANSAKVTQDMHHGVECDPRKNSGSAIEYVRTGAIPAGQDLKTYDLATLQIATNGAKAGLTVGELWVTYKVVLRKTKLLLAGAVGRTTTAFARFTWGIGGSISQNGSSTSLFRFKTDSTGVVVEPKYLDVDDTSVEPPPNNIQLNQFVNVYGLLSKDEATNTLTLPSNINNGRYRITMIFTTSTSPTAVAELASSVGLAKAPVSKSEGSELGSLNMVAGSVISNMVTVIQTGKCVVTHEFQIANDSSAPVSITYKGLDSIVFTDLVLTIEQLYYFQ